MKQVYLIPHRCMGCEECLVSCEKAHDWETRAYVEIVDGYFPFPMRCNHCQDPPCMAACPRDAIKRSAAGAVVVDPDRCIGCGTCVIVCPFGVPYVSARTGKVVKCDLCDDRVTAGDRPICVESCPKGALEFGELDEPLAMRRQRLARHIKGASLAL
jgi:Fe-S-cluster-containing dehydrogenase component